MEIQQKCFIFLIPSDFLTEIPSVRIRQTFLTASPPELPAEFSCRHFQWTKQLERVLRKQQYCCIILPDLSFKNPLPPSIVDDGPKTRVQVSHENVDAFPNLVHVVPYSMDELRKEEELNVLSHANVNDPNGVDNKISQKKVSNIEIHDESKESKEERSNESKEGRSKESKEKKYKKTEDLKPLEYRVFALMSFLSLIFNDRSVYFDSIWEVELSIQLNAFEHETRAIECALQCFTLGFASIKFGNVENVVNHTVLECENVNAGFLLENSHAAEPPSFTPVVEGVYVLLKDVNGEFVNGEVYPPALPLTIETPTTKEDTVSVTLVQGVLNESMVAMVANGELGVGGMNSDTVTVSLSPNAIPFFPPALASVSNVIMSTISTENLNNSEGGAAFTSSVALVPFVLEAEPPSSGVRDEGNLIANRLIEVPVNLIDTQSMAKCVGDSSGLDIRNHINWLNVSSDCESEDEFSEGGLASLDFCGVSDTGNDFSLGFALKPSGGASGVASARRPKALSGSSSGSASLPDLKVSSFRGMPSLWISELEIQSLTPLEFSLVGKFPTNPSAEDGRRSGGVAMVLSPNAIPFTPLEVLAVNSLVGNCISEGVVVLPSVNLCENLVVPIQVPASDPISPGVMGACNPIENVNISADREESVKISSFSSSDLRCQMNWQDVSSEYELGSEFSDAGVVSPNFCGGSDPGNDFSLVSVRPVSVASRGRFCGSFRGR
ncbi:hypothetical protein MA16_Dca026076 [Dendrobium catenatum]|uniref:Uncharacterized protein n=1 Tax=Dendrobium catenatum TaxID=906689 RepID=A0A2I0X7Y3_9ASPA|nr:hypothetical protein MA16_Dca026076 [Dendrobium catenatum]